MTVKSEGEKKSWFGRIKNRFYGINENHDPIPKRKYTQVSDSQILEMLRLRKENPNLSHCKIAKLVDVSDAVANYYLVLHTEKQVRKILRGRKSRRKTQYKKTHKVTKTPKSTKEIDQIDEPFTMSNDDSEISLSTFTQISEAKGKQILKQLNVEEKHPIHHKANPEKFKGAVPSQAVATEEEWKEEDRKYKIGKAVMHKAIVTKEKAEVENKVEADKKAHRKVMHKQGLTEKGTPLKIHIDDKCPSCNENSTLTLKEYNSVVYTVYQELRDFKIEKKKIEKQLEGRSKQLDDMEKESLGTVADRVKEGTKVCLKCDRPITYQQAQRSSGMFGAGQYYCGTHEPKENQK